MTIAITGAKGFVGAALVKALQTQYPLIKIIEIDKANGWDILKKQELEEKLPQFDTLIHLAALTFVPESYNDPYRYYTINLTGTLNVLELCRKRSASFVYISSYMYGHPQYLPIDEKHLVSAVNPYGQSKLMGEELAAAYSRDFGLPVIALRLFNLYGLNQDKNFLLAKILDAAKTGNITLFDPRPKRDFIYIDDVVQAIICAVNLHPIKNFSVYNIGFGKSYSISEIVDIVAEYYPGLSVTFTGETRPNEILDTVSNIEKAKIELKWQPTVDIKEGIARIINSNKKNEAIVDR